MDPIIIIGSGLAGYGVLRELRKQNKDVPLKVICADKGDFYSKPMLSTALAKGKTPTELITTSGAKMAEQQNFDLLAGTMVTRIDPAARTLETSAGEFRYSKLVLALGADPIRPRLGGNAAGDPLPINHLDDYELFRGVLDGARHVAIIGAGLVGCEFANDLNAVGISSTVIDPLPLPMSTFLPPAAGEALRDALGQGLVTWRLGVSVSAVDKEGKSYRLTLSDGTAVDADVVVSAVGLRCHTKLAEQAGLAVKRGILVDETGRTSDPDIYAIGDCAEYSVGVVNFITPIMAAARAVAGSALGTATTIKFPTLSVIVKTTAYPIALLRPAEGVTGEWVEQERDAAGLKLVFRTADHAIAGYVLTAEKCAQRPDLDKEIAAAQVVAA